MFLDATTKRLTVTVDGAADTTESSVIASYVDYAAASTTPGEQDAVTTGATAAEVVSAPESMIQRHIIYMTIYNEDTAAHVFTVKLDNNGTLRTIVSMRLDAGETLQYTKTNGWEIVQQASAAHQSVDLDIDAEDEFTDGLLVKAGEAVSISISGSFTATITLQRNLNGSDWNDVPLPDGSAGWTAPTEMTYFADETGFLRIGVKTGDFGSGSPTVRLGVH
ncbi:hypothetical protein GC176_20505 [bacterium]|nr:hypothetical protein [bacterium]